MQVQLVVDEEKGRFNVEARLGVPVAEGAEFAFYLMRGKERMAARWYAPAPAASFASPAAAGRYHAIGFARSRGAEKAVSAPSNAVDFSPAPPGGAPGAVRARAKPEASPFHYDAAAWNLPIRRHADLDEALADGMADDGIHQIGLADGQTLDMCAQGLAGAGAPPRAILVNFTAALGNRGGKRAPFFSGLGIAKALGLPLLAFSDPTLALDGEIVLGWYLGNAGVPDLPHRIARILDACAARTGAKLVLFGGSGGGFAALSHLALLQGNAAGAVWNPQTSVSEYDSGTVGQYLSVAFPQFRGRVDAVRALAAASQRRPLKRLLDEAGLRHDLTALPRGHRHPLVYLQNQSDWHNGRHAQPYLKRHAWSRLSRRSFGDEAWLAACHFGDWGQGHIAPSYAAIAKILSGLADGASAADIAVEIDRESDMDGEPYVWFDES